MPPPPAAVTSSLSGASCSSGANQSLPLPLMTSLHVDDDNEQSILDQHFNNIGWDQSRGQTPTGGTGRHSPEHLQAQAQASMMAAGAGANVSTLLHNSLNLSSTSGPHQAASQGGKTTSAAYGGAHAHKKRSNERDVGSHSMVSFDSGVVDDHRHHHAHNHNTSVARHLMTSAAANRSFASSTTSHNSYLTANQRHLPPAALAPSTASSSQAAGATPSGSVFSNQTKVLFDDRKGGSTSMRHARRSVDAMTVATVADSGITELGPPLAMSNTVEPAKQK